MTPEEHRTAGLACAFLIDGRCSAHDVRPSACAAYHSLSRERCERSFRDPAHIGTTRNARPALLELQVLGTALIEATQAACVAAGLPGEQVELHQGLRALLASSEPL
jgi:Fe-S-cluster containining protein